MKCHYEVLDISRDADDNEIKTAYRKLALKWHPDKNLENTEYAKEQFQLVQQAYEILSDRQERAWYDKHREQILRGSNTDYKDNNLDVFQYFTTTCFKGYGDDENGFYCIYGKVFEQIAKEDYEYMDDKSEMYDVPQFGNSESDYDEVVAQFYDYWMSYSTKKSYVWLDPHNIKEALNRKAFKLIEKENDKIRQKAKRERNEEVRNLVAFVRKRDKRVQAHIKKLEEKKVENREKQKKLSNQQRLERIKQLNESSEQAEWMKFDNVKSNWKKLKKLAAEFGDDTSDSEENSDIEEINNLYCVACNKIFKTPKAFKNHESSKKHKENVENLKQVMLEDSLLEETLSNSSRSSEHTSDTVDQLENDISINLSVEEKRPEGDDILDNKTRKKNKKGRNVIKVIESCIDEEVNNGIILQNSDDNSENELSSSKKKKQKKKKDRRKKDDSGTVSNENASARNKSALIEPKDITEKELDVDHCCAKCKAQFSSKNRLFEHLKKSGHSCYLNTSNVLDKSRKKFVKQK